MSANAQPRYFAPGEIPRILRHGVPSDPPPPAPEPSPAPPGLHQQIVRISEVALLDYLTGKRQVTNIPDGAKLLSFWFDIEYDGKVETGKYLCIRIEHESLPEVEPGRRIPQARAKYRLANNGEAL